MVILLGVFDFAHVKLTDTTDLVMFVNDRRCLALCLRQHNVDEVLLVNRNQFNVRITKQCGKQHIIDLREFYFM